MHCAFCFLLEEEGYNASFNNSTQESGLPSFGISRLKLCQEEFTEVQLADQACVLCSGSQPT